MRSFSKYGSRILDGGGVAAVPVARATVAVAILFFALVCGAAGQTWNSSAKAASSNTKSVLLTYSQNAGFYPAAINRSAGSFLIHLAVRDHESTPTFQVSDATGANIHQGTVEKGKLIAVQAVNLAVGVYRITATGDATHACIITVTNP